MTSADAQIDLRTLLDLIHDYTHSCAESVRLDASPNQGLDDLALLTREVTRQIDAATRTAVRNARERYVPWADIGLALHVTKQAAQQRYGGA